MSESGCCGSGCDPCILDVTNLELEQPGKENCLRADCYRPFTVSQVEQIGQTVLLISWRCNGDGCSLQALPGQHVILRAPQDPPFFSRPYTLVPLPGATGPSALVRLRPGGRMSAHLAALRVGDTSHLRGPFGEFRLSSPAPRLLLVGTGVGVAPLYAVAAAAAEGDSPVRLLLSNGSLRLLPLRAQLAELACCWNVSVKLFVGAEDGPRWVREQLVPGRIGRPELEAELGPDRGRGLLVAVCGGAEFKENIARHLASLEHAASVHIF